MCGPTGIGILWGRQEILENMPPYRGGGEMIDEVYMSHSTYTSPPGRFEAGTPNIANALGLKSAIDYLTGIGMERIEAYEKELGKYLFLRMKALDPELGLVILGPPFTRLDDEASGGGKAGSFQYKSWKVPLRATATVAFVVKEVHPSDLSTFLDMEGVAIRAGHHCCQPLHRALGYSHSARASLYFYNTKRFVLLNTIFHFV
jgi:cysteine desulfurase/selenocysteine lyase